MARSTDMPSPARIPDPNNPKLFLTGSVSGSGVAVVGTDNRLHISGRGFVPGASVVLSSPDAAVLRQSVSTDRRGQFVL